MLMVITFSKFYSTEANLNECMGLLEAEKCLKKSIMRDDTYVFMMWERNFLKPRQPFFLGGPNYFSSLSKNTL